MVVGIRQMIVEAVVVGVGSRGNAKIVEWVGSPSWDCGFLGIGLVSLGRNFRVGYSNSNTGQDAVDLKKNAKKYGVSQFKLNTGQVEVVLILIRGRL